MSDKKIKFKYAASSNISFHGEWETDWTREEWDQLSGPEQDRELSEVLFNLVDIWIEDGE